MLSDLRIVRPLKVNDKWNIKDYLGTIKVRLSFGRTNYKVEPGIYAFNNPETGSDVFVTANYKLSFDILRQSLKGLNAWILVLDTKGVNVWCAAGKGTFGTNELIKQIKNARLSEMVNHRYLIVPQLGAPGINANQVKLETGFTVEFGPVKASDIKLFVESGYKKSEQMRTVQFSFVDRLKIVPVEIVNAFSKFLILATIFFIVAGGAYSNHVLSFDLNNGLKVVVLLLVAYLAGAAITPALLPWLPFRSFSAKGLIAGAFFMIIALLIVSLNNLILASSIFLIGIAITSFLAMNFTGASTYTSLSGVRKEMGIYVPVQAVIASLGIVGFIISKFINI
jgi:hypothetical protein